MNCIATTDVFTKKKKFKNKTLTIMLLYSFGQKSDSLVISMTFFVIDLHTKLLVCRYIAVKLTILTSRRKLYIYDLQMS